MFVVLLAIAAMIATGCRLVGSGTLDYVEVEGDSSAMGVAATSGSLATIQAFRAADGAEWPPPGQVAVVVRADHIPPISSDLAPERLSLVLLAPNETCGYLEFVQGGMMWVDSGGSQVIAPILAGDDRVIAEVVLVDAAKLPEGEVSWAIANFRPTIGDVNAHRAIRCGTMTIAP
jgi:hypothetical protein